MSNLLKHLEAYRNKEKNFPTYQELIGYKEESHFLNKHLDEYKNKEKNFPTYSDLISYINYELKKM